MLRSKKIRAAGLCVLLGISLLLSRAWAHVPGQCAVFLQTGQNLISGRLSIFYSDLLMFTRGIPDDLYTLKTAGILAHEQTIKESLKTEFHFLVDGERRDMQNLRLSVDEEQFPFSVLLQFDLGKTTGPPSSVRIETSELFNSNPQYMVLVNLTAAGKQKTVILSENMPSAELFIDPVQEFLVFLKYGMEHICLGFDHLFFLVLLILSPFLSARGRVKELRFRRISWGLVKLATAFTVAHSLTLFLAVMSFSLFPQGLVELIILGSIMFMGLYNLFQFDIGREWLIVFAFGLFHGYGFSSALKNLGLGRDNLIIPLAGFNLGVEAGQLLIILACLIALYKLTSRKFNSVKFLRWVCAIITVIASLWFLERLLQVLGVIN